MPVLPNFRGKLKEMDAKVIRLELDDYRVLEFRVTGKTKYIKNGDDIKSPKFSPGDQLSVEGSEEPDGSMTAVNVYWEKAAAAGGTQETKDAPVDTWKNAPPPESATERTAPPAPRAGDDPGPPVLRRGKPVQRDADATPEPPAEPPKQIAGNLPLPAADLPQRAAAPEKAEDQSPLGSHQEDPLIRKATEAALEFTESLPNYVCQEMMSRAESSSQPANWSPMDVVSVEVVYENGRENYRNLAVNGKATSKKMEELGGAWSTGEFGTVLIDLFSPATAAEFQSRGESRIAGLTAKLYDFSVERGNSHWTLHFGSQSYEPAYGGRVWIDPQTGRVLRIEMQAHELPRISPPTTWRAQPTISTCDWEAPSSSCCPCMPRP